MTKSIRILIWVAVAGVISMASCTKNYHCQCTYNNTVRLNKDLGVQTRENALDECEGYDSTVVGEKWTCVLN